MPRFLTTVGRMTDTRKTETGTTMTEYRVISLTDGRYRHLGSVERGGVTACGVRFDWSAALVEVAGSVGVGCLRCDRSLMMRRALAEGVDL